MFVFQFRKFKNDPKKVNFYLIKEILIVKLLSIIENNFHTASFHQIDRTYSYNSVFFPIIAPKVTS